MIKSILTCACLLTLLFGCGGEIEPGRKTAEAPVIHGLPRAKAESLPVPEGVFHVGTVESSDRGTLAARIDGRILRIAVHEGDPVAKGDLLMTLGDNQGGERLAEAEGARRAAAARLDLATRTQARYQELFSRSAVTPQEMDQINAELEMARQGLAQASAAEEAARTLAGHSRVTAPYGARVVRKLVEEGSTVLPGTPLLLLDRTGTWRVRVQLPESLMPRTHVGDAFTVVIPALGKTVAGKVSQILPATDPGSRSFAVKIDLAPLEGLSAGLFARAAAAGEAARSLLVPATALVQRGQLTGLFVVEDNILHYRLVKTGRTFDGEREILSGLSEGETYIVDQTLRARNGARVED